MSLKFPIPEHRLEVKSARSSGPGGQHVNKTETKIEIRFHLESADWIPPVVRERFAQLYPTRLTSTGEVVVTSQESRSQEQNYRIALEKLAELLEVASRIPKKRVKTKPTRGSKERRLNSKKKHSSTKASRRWKAD